VCYRRAVSTDNDARTHGPKAPGRPPSLAGTALLRHALAAIVTSSLLGAPGLAAAQSDEDKAAARALALQGVAALNAGKYADALDLVSRAEQLLHAPPHLLLIARAQAGLGRFVAAQESYLRLLREDIASTAPLAFKKAQQDARDEVAAIEPRIAQLRISLDGAGSRKMTVKMDDQPVSPALLGVYRPVDPGKHEIVAAAAGQGPVKGTVELQEGERKELKLTIPEGTDALPPRDPVGRTPDVVDPWSNAPPPRDPAGAGFFTPVRGVGIGVGALGVAGVVAGAVFLAKGTSAASESETRFAACKSAGTCAGPYTREARAIAALDDEAARSKTIGAAALIGGGVALGVGVALIVLGKPQARPVSQAAVMPWFSGTAAGVRGVF
jgi:hypothetical protein